jgi:predicted DNA-binding WGR domain protein
LIKDYKYVRWVAYEENEKAIKSYSIFAKKHGGSGPVQKDGHLVFLVPGERGSGNVRSSQRMGRPGIFLRQSSPLDSGVQDGGAFDGEDLPVRIEQEEADGSSVSPIESNVAEGFKKIFDAGVSGVKDFTDEMDLGVRPFITLYQDGRPVGTVERDWTSKDLPWILSIGDDDRHMTAKEVKEFVKEKGLRIASSVERRSSFLTSSASPGDHISLRFTSEDGKSDKFIDMDYAGGPTFTATWGRFGSEGRQTGYPVEEWDSYYRQKTVKGYKDVTDGDSAGTKTSTSNVAESSPALKPKPKPRPVSDPKQLDLFASLRTKISPRFFVG